MMYQNVFSNGGWYETIVRPYDLLHRRRHDLGTDPPKSFVMVVIAISLLILGYNLFCCS